MKEHDIQELFQRSQEIEAQTSPYVDRNLGWWQGKNVEEATEWSEENPEEDMHNFLLEGADVMIAWISTMRMAGVSWQTAFEAVKFKYDILEARISQTVQLMQEGHEYEVAYQQVKDASKSQPS